MSLSGDLFVLNFDTPISFISHFILTILFVLEKVNFKGKINHKSQQNLDRFITVFQMSAAKISTNLTRMAVAKNPHAKLASIYSKNLRVLGKDFRIVLTYCALCLTSFYISAKMPTDYAYRKHAENIISERAAMVKNESNVAELEKKINGGQIEEVIIQAENELNLSRNILEWKSWEPLMSHPPPNQWKWPM